MSHTWVQHGDTRGFWRCPDGALPQWRALGWEPCSPPEIDDDPTTAERRALEAQSADPVRRVAAQIEE